nr:MAG TPA: hypothetical protein [Caudoviricetes sp.]
MKSLVQIIVICLLMILLIYFISSVFNEWFWLYIVIGVAAAIAATALIHKKTYKSPVKRNGQNIVKK